MVVNNRTSNTYELTPDLRLDPQNFVEFDDTVWSASLLLQQTVNGLLEVGAISVPDAPDGWVIDEEFGAPPLVHIVGQRPPSFSTPPDTGGGSGTSGSLVSVAPYSLVVTQSSPSTHWVINHGLASFPGVTVVDSAGSVVLGNVVYTDENTVEILFSAAFSGAVYLT